ncbi:MAG: hypothetical protein ACYC91_06910 [Solirubrobacteraceae bacterium]
MLPSASLWATYHRMNVFELAQLFSDLDAQNVTKLRSRPSGRLAARLYASLRAFNSDLYQIYLASRAPRSTKAHSLAVAARKFKQDADKFAAIHGLASIAPNAPLSAHLFGFAVEGLIANKPNAPAAPVPSQVCLVTCAGPDNDPSAIAVVPTTLSGDERLRSDQTELCIGQYFGPHIEQNSAVLK